MPARALLLSLMFALSCTACGLRGPLYLPGERDTGDPSATAEETTDKSRTPRIPAPQSQKRESSAPGTTDMPVTRPDPDRPATPPGSDR